MIDDFRWNDWNLDHATKHGVTVGEIESVVRNAKPPWPEYRGDDKWLVMGRDSGGRLLQVIYLVSPAPYAFVIHARPLTDKEKKVFHRRSR